MPGPDRHREEVLFLFEKDDILRYQRRLVVHIFILVIQISKNANTPINLNIIL
jgi:hypothetical protein